MKRLSAMALVALTAVACTDSSPVVSEGPSAAATPPPVVLADADVFVSNSNDAGPGSFRDAIGQASGDPSIDTIAFLPSVKEIGLQSGIVFDGTQDLTIHGNKATVDGAAAGGTAFMATGGGDLELIELTFRNAQGEGVHVEVPSTLTGEIEVTLTDVNILNNTGHGVLVNDQDDPSTTDGVEPDPDGSPASVKVVVTNSRFEGNGFSVSDRDGIRVNEGGAGDLTFILKRTVADGNAADGAEIDERGPGDVHIDVWQSHFTRNGAFDPADLDDGFDIDEYQAGGIFGTASESSANHNYEEGFDFNENDPEGGPGGGSLRVDMTSVDANFNGEEGIDLEEDDDFGSGGNLVTFMDRVTTVGNGIEADGGLKVREKEAGNLDVTLTNIISSNNFGAGIFARESQSGSSAVSIDGAVANGNATFTNEDGDLVRGDGIALIGSVVGSVSNATLSANEGFGIFGEGTITLTNVNGNGNGLGATGGPAFP